MSFEIHEVLPNPRRNGGHVVTVTLERTHIPLHVIHQGTSHAAKNASAATEVTKPERKTPRRRTTTTAEVPAVEADMVPAVAPGAPRATRRTVTTAAASVRTRRRRRREPPSRDDRSSSWRNSLS